ncbi:zinc finger, CCHC-type containing protein [Tanacetum coccineum]
MIVVTAVRVLRLVVKDKDKGAFRNRANWVQYSTPSVILGIPSPFVIVLTLWSLLLGPGAVPTDTTLSNRNTIELPVGNNVVPLRSDTIRLVQNGCSFHELRSEDPNQHLKDFLKLVELLDLDGDNRERTRLRLFQFSLRDLASNWLERLPAGSITTWEDLTTRFLAQFFSPGRTAKLRNDILMFQQHHGESLSEA